LCPRLARRERGVDRHRLELDPQRGEVGAALSAALDAQLAFQDLPRPALGANGAGRHRQPQLIRELGELNPDQGAGVSQERVQIHRHALTLSQRAALV